MIQAAEGKSKRKGPLVIGAVVTAGALIAILANLTTILAFLGVSNPLSAPKLYQYGPVTPGQNCDHQQARWVVAYAVASCLPSDNALDELQLVATSHDSIGQLFFYGVQPLPRNVQIQVDVDGLSAGGCAGVTARDANNRPGAYAFEVCSNGKWIIAKYMATSASPVEQPFNLATGSVPPATAYHLVVTVDGVSLRFDINAAPEAVAADGAYPGADTLSLFVSPLATTQGTATFQNFMVRQIQD